MGPGFCADLDQIEALTGEREALWARLNAVSFLTANEKRAAVGYGPLRASDEEALVTGPFDDVLPEAGKQEWVLPEAGRQERVLPEAGKQGGSGDCRSE